MKDWNKLGGGASLIAAATFIFGFVLFATALADFTTGDPTPAESVAFLVDNQGVLQLWNAVIYVLFGIVLIPLALALYHHLKAASPIPTQVATVFALVWSGLVLATGMVANIAIATVADLHDANPGQAEPVWSALESVQNGLGGGNEIVGGLWVVLISMAALQAGALVRPMNYFGIVAGIAGIVTIVPVLEPVGAVFGIGLIIWFIWLGIVLIRHSSGPVDQQSAAGIEAAGGA